MTRASLEIRLLGELEVTRDGKSVALPQSKKTRALLAYLVLTDREHRRERLCDLLWDVADDRRGALRWSLSKLRTLVDDDGAPRITADRDRVSFARRGAYVDALEVRRALAGKPLDSVATEVLERSADAFRGELLEGLDLPEFDEYQAWCVAEREQTRSLHTALLAELTRRLAGDPARATEIARAWVRVDPMDDRARATLIRLLGALGRRDEARQHYETGRRLEKELGRLAHVELTAAWREVDAQGARAAAPVEATTAPAPVDGGPRAHATTTPRLVGRTAEMAALTALAERSARDGRLGVCLISGEPGVGKTRLLEAWEEEVRRLGGDAIHGAAYEAESGHPYAAWVGALSCVRGDDGAHVDRWAELVGGELPSRDRLFARVASALAEMASRRKPLAIVLDDVHWLDEGSAELLHWVARTNRDRPLAIALATRIGEIADNAPLVRVLRGLRREGVVEELVLGALGPDETATLVKELGAEAHAARIHARSGGNPLFSLELARSVREGASDDAGVPASLGGLVRDRVAQLPGPPADVLRWAAVLGASFTLDHLERLLGQDASSGVEGGAGLDSQALVGALEVLERRALLVRDGASYAFSHEIVRQVVYADLSEPRRRLMHRRAAQLLARAAKEAGASGRAGEIIADVARHAALAHDAALAAEACIGAARRSLRVFASADALALARRGRRHAERLDDPERTQRLIELAEVSFEARRPDDVDAESRRVEALAERALDLGCHEHARLGFHLVSFLRWERGVWSDAKRHSLQAELVSRGASDVERVRGMAEAARCLVLLERDLGHAQALALEAAARGRQVGVEPPATYDALGMLELHRGRLSEAAIELERARELARAHRNHHDEFQALEHLVMLEIERGDRDAALMRAEELASLGERFRDGSEAPFARALVALVRIAGGEGAFHEELDRQLQALTVVDAKHRLAYVLTRAALLDLGSAGATPDAERGRRRAEQALGIATLLERASEVALARVALLRAASVAGETETADRHREALRAIDLGLVAEHVGRMVRAELDGAVARRSA